MKFRVIITLLILFGIFLNASGAFSQERKKLPIPGLYNTGVDNNKYPIADGETDPHYFLSTSADAGFPGPDVKVVYTGAFPIGPWIQNDNESKWIAPRADAGEFNAPGVYVYTLVFSLDGFKPETAEIRGYWTSDNNGSGIMINGSITDNFSPYNAFESGLFPFEIKEGLGFRAGTNSISFIVFNGEAPTGLRVVIYGEAEPIDVASLHSSDDSKSSDE